MEFFNKIVAWFDSTKIHQQILDVDYVGLFQNPWFMVPFCSMIGYMLFKKRLKDIIIIAVLLGVWWVSGTEYMHSLINNGEIQIEKILPVVFGGAIVLGFVIYLLFGRSD